MNKKIGFCIIAMFCSISINAQEPQINCILSETISDEGVSQEWVKEDKAIHSKESSSLAPQGNNTYIVSNLSDGDFRSSWVEGVSGYGVGEWIEYTFPAGIIINEVTIVNGYVKSQSSWENNSRVKQLKVYFNGIAFAVLNLKDERSYQSFPFWKGLGLEQRNWTLRFEIVDVYKGKKYDDTALTGIYFGTPRQSTKGVKISAPTVDLGLSVKWASCNVGASAAEQQGKSFDWESAKQLEKDGWRLPTKEDFKELIQSCDGKWTTQNGVNGYLFTAKNGNTLFFPTSKNYNDYCMEECGRYWSGSAEQREHIIDDVDYYLYTWGIYMQINNTEAIVETCGDSSDCSLDCYPIRMVR